MTNINEEFEIKGKEIMFRSVATAVGRSIDADVVIVVAVNSIIGSGSVMVSKNDLHKAELIACLRVMADEIEADEIKKSKKAVTPKRDAVLRV